MNKEKITLLYQKCKPYLKYIIVVVIFGILIFFGKYGCVRRMAIDKEVRILKEQNDNFQQKIEKAQTEIEQLKNSRDDLERWAREHGMQQENEDIFIIKEK